MGQRQTISGRRTGLVWLGTLFALALVAIIVVVIFVIAPDRRRQQQLEAHYNACVAFRAAGDWDRAVEACGEAVAIDAGYEDVQARYAEVRAKQQEVLATVQAETAQATATAQARAEATAAAATTKAGIVQATSVATTATAQAKATVQAQEAEATATAEALAQLEAHYQKGLGYINLEKWVEAKAELEQVFEEDPNYKDVQAKLTGVETEVAKLIPTATPPPPNPEIIELKPDYDSGWVADNRSTNHRTVFTHNLGVIPSRVTIWFSPSEPHQVVYPLLWSWTPGNSGNPVTVELSATRLVLGIWSGDPLHGVWRGDLVQWTYYDSGYWRVLLWR